MEKRIKAVRIINNRKHPLIPLQFFGSNVRCKVCGGWGGEFGDAKGVGHMCSECYFKKYGTYE